jgi:hypothetical protein
MITGTPLQGLLALEPRDRPEYNEIWCRAGMPPSMPKPRPYYSRLAAPNLRFAYVGGRTAMQSVTIPAGQTALFVPMPYRINGMNAYVTTGGAGVPTSTMDWTAEGVSKDQSHAGAVAAAWEGIAPQTLYEDSDLVDATYYTHLPATGRVPLLKQQLGVRSTLKLATTYDGQADIWIASPGDCPDYIGRKQESHKFDPLTDASAVSTGHIPGSDLSGIHHTTFMASASESPVDFCKRVGKLHTVSGNQSAVFHVDGSPEYGWTYWGTLNSAAPSNASDEGYKSTNHNFEPRDNIPYFVKNGMTIVTNNSATDSLVVHYRARFEWATILQSDDGNRNISGLASLARFQAPQLTSHVPPIGPLLMRQSLLASDAGHLAALHATADRAGPHHIFHDYLSKTSTQLHHGPTAKWAKRGEVAGLALAGGAQAYGLYKGYKARQEASRALRAAPEDLEMGMAGTAGEEGAVGVAGAEAAEGTAGALEMLEGIGLGMIAL